MGNKWFSTYTLFYKNIVHKDIEAHEKIRFSYKKVCISINDIIPIFEKDLKI